MSNILHKFAVTFSFLSGFVAYVVLAGLTFLWVDNSSGDPIGTAALFFVILYLLSLVAFFVAMVIYGRLVKVESNSLEIIPRKKVLDYFVLVLVMPFCVFSAHLFISLMWN